MLDNITFAMPETPSLMTMLSMGNDSFNPAAYGPQTAARVLNKFDVMDLLLINFDGECTARMWCTRRVRLTHLFSDSERPSVPPPRSHLPNYAP